MGQGDTRMCFLDKERRCPDSEYTSNRTCMAWDGDMNDCVILAQMRIGVLKDCSVTTFPVSAPPPEVK